jgi:hypothetical protein
MDDFSFRTLAAEAGDLLHRLGLHRGAWIKAALVHSAALLLFGVLVPYAKGLEFLDSVALGAYACLGVVFASPAAAVPFAQPSLGRAIARILVCVKYGTAMAWSMLLAGIVTVYSTSPFLIGLDLVSLAECALFGVALATAAAAIAVWVTVQFSAKAAKGAMRLVFVSLLVAFFWYSRWLPGVALRGAAVATVVAAAFIVLLRTGLPHPSESLPEQRPEA